VAFIEVELPRVIERFLGERGERSEQAGDRRQEGTR